MHHIQKHILGILINVKRARFSDMRPPRVDSNAYSYHLKSLQKAGLVERHEGGYRLSPPGLAFVDRVSMEKFEPRLQPKVITMLVITNKAGQTLLWSKVRQPFVGSWTLPYGKMHLSDMSAEAAARREYAEEFDQQPPNLRHAASVNIRAKIAGELVSYVVAHIFAINQENYKRVRHEVLWADRQERDGIKLAPAVNEVVELATTDQPFCFAEIDEDW